MSKTKRKTRSEQEHLRGYIKELEKTVRSLQQQLRQYEKYEQNSNSQDEEFYLDSEDTKKEFKMKSDCFDCGKGKMVETINLGTRGIYGACDHCGFKGRMK